jgi:S-DNA-T family DNA segregation ATPase FtsK/SpoIIIE
MEESIITDTKKVIHTLKVLCKEMDSRYEFLKNAGVRNIREYNAKLKIGALDKDLGHKFLPYIVLVIDEFADLMMVAGKEVEMPIARIAQLARAVGIHLIIATQRPSVNVITGIIKANFPARISFKVSSKVDSRTILDTSGAEQLIGRGDLLLSINSDIIRLQCPLLETDEIENICGYIDKQNFHSEDYELIDIEEKDDDKIDLTGNNLQDKDPMFDEAAQIIVANQLGSTSLLQRKLQIGYARAGRVMDQIEQAGIVGPADGS